LLAAIQSSWRPFVTGRPVPVLNKRSSYALVPKLTDFPIKGGLMPPVPVDPLLYRFHEILQIYGLPLKDVIQEVFGDGIMSAIDFTLHVEKETDPMGDRVRITMSGKFLPYKKW
jgi:cyanate lyase